MDSYLFFNLDQYNFALPIDKVDKTIRVVAITELPRAPEIVLGIINLNGNIIPVINLRKKLGLIARPLQLSDKFIIVFTKKNYLALWVDDIQDVIRVPDNYIVKAQNLYFNIDLVKASIKYQNDIFLIYDLEKCLNNKEKIDLIKALDLYRERI